MSKNTKRWIIISAVATLALALVALITYSYVQNEISQKQPIYQTLLPEGKTVEQLGGWQRVSPPKAAPVFAYTDSLDGITIGVSQQAIPNSFKGNIEGETEKLAKSYNSDRVLTADNIKFYVGVSANGPQSVIFTKDDVLVMVKSQDKISDASWISYIKSLNAS